MKISLLTGHLLTHPEVDIRCRENDNEVKKIVCALHSCEKRLVAKLNDEIVFLHPSTVLYFETVDRTTFAYSNNQVLVVQNPLKELTSTMFYGYFRVSKSMVVNVIHISSVIKLLNGNLDITMDNDEHVTISRRYVPEFNQFIKNGGI